jgi:hypothetical protein
MNILNDTFNLINASPKKQKHPKHVLSLLRNWAIEANEINPEKSISFYYKLFIERLEKVDDLRTLWKEFFKDRAIEV